MQTILIILAVLAVSAAVYYFGFYKQGKINDRDGDFIPDEIEDAVEDVKKVAKTVKRRAKKVKAELGDVVGELQDVVQAIKGKPTKSKLNSLTKQQLIDAAKKDHGADFDLTVKKSTLVNKVYSLYNKK
jgi:ABC-type transporter Mla subunit MlaD